MTDEQLREITKRQDDHNFWLFMIWLMVTNLVWLTSCNSAHGQTIAIAATNQFVEVPITKGVIIPGIGGPLFDMQASKTVSNTNSFVVPRAESHRTYLRTDFVPIICPYCTNIHHYRAVETYQQGVVKFTNVIDHPAVYQSPDPRAKAARALPMEVVAHRSRMRPVPVLPPLPP